MMRHVVSVLCLLLVTLSTTSYAKQKSHSWLNGMCENTIRYDSKKFDEQAVKDTVYLLYEAYQVLYVGAGLVSVPEEITRLRRDELHKQCKENHDRLVGLQLLQTPHLKGKLEPLRQDLIETQDLLCSHADIHMRGYTVPSALREFKGASQCDYFINALEDDTKLESTWREFIKTLCANNASFDDCSKRELTKATLPNAKAHMRITLIAFGWNNCTNESAWRGSDALQAKLNVAAKTLEKQFKAKVVCEEP